MKSKSTVYQSFIALCLAFASLLVGFFVGGFVSLLVAEALCLLKGADVRASELLQNPAAFPAYRTVFLLVQGVYSLIVFLFVPYLFLKFFGKFSLPHFLKPPEGQIQMLGFVCLILLSFFPLSGYLVYLNQQVVFPEYLAWLEVILQEKEQSLMQSTRFLTNFGSPFEFLLGLLVIAVIPAIGEEYFFRGILQEKILGLTHKKHLSIWISAFVFSAFHLQFYGILPRMALGGLFGYLYLWSGSIRIPMVAHFLNNAFTLSVMYFFTASPQVPFGEKMPSAAPLPWPYILLFLLLSVSLMLVFRKKYAGKTV